MIKSVTHSPFQCSKLFLIFIHLFFKIFSYFFTIIGKILISTYNNYVDYLECTHECYHCVSRPHQRHRLLRKLSSYISFVVSRNVSNNRYIRLIKKIIRSVGVSNCRRTLLLAVILAVTMISHNHGVSNFLTH